MNNTFFQSEFGKACTLNWTWPCKMENGPVSLPVDVSNRTINRNTLANICGAVLVAWPNHYSWDVSFRRSTTVLRHDVWKVSNDLKCVSNVMTLKGFKVVLRSFKTIWNECVWTISKRWLCLKGFKQSSLLFLVGGFEGFRNITALHFVAKPHTMKSLQKFCLCRLCLWYHSFSDYPRFMIISEDRNKDRF